MLKYWSRTHCWQRWVADYDAQVATEVQAKAVEQQVEQRLTPLQGVESDVTKPYEPTPQERAALRMKVSEKGGVPQVSPDHPEPALGATLLMSALGTTEPDFLNGLLGQLANAGSQGREVDERRLNFMLAVVKGVEPQDQVEALLAAQMAAVHNATMTFARRLNHVENIPQQDSAERKLARIFAAQVEALKRYRTGGEQKVTGAALHGHLEAGEVLPGARCKRLDRLPLSWRAWRHAQGQGARALQARALYNGGNFDPARAPRASPGKPGHAGKSSMRGGPKSAATLPHTCLVVCRGLASAPK